MSYCNIHGTNDCVECVRDAVRENTMVLDKILAEMREQKKTSWWQRLKWWHR